MPKGKIAKKEPCEVELTAGKAYAWCACGESSGQPLCDGSHSGTDLKPHVMVAEKDEKVWFCQCKQTNTPPYCDGSHKHL